MESSLGERRPSNTSSISLASLETSSFPPEATDHTNTTTPSFDMSDAIAKAFGSVPKLTGKENFVVWKQRITLALSLCRATSFTLATSTPPASDEKAKSDWHERDHQIAAGLLTTTDEAILTAHIHLLDQSERRTYQIFSELTRVYGTSGAQYTSALGCKFVQSKCAPDEDVEAWVNNVLALYRELKVLSFDLDLLCVNVLLNGIPERFSAYIDQVWAASESPSIEDVRVAILRINAGHQNRATDTHGLAAKLDSTSLDPSLTAFYTSLKKSGKRPSAQYPCARCGSAEHWVVDCTHSLPGQGRSRRNRRPFNNAKPEEATAAIASIQDLDTSKPPEHVLVATFASSALVVKKELKSDRLSTLPKWLLDSGASSHMTGDSSLLSDLISLTHPIEVKTADGSIAATHYGRLSLLNHADERVTIEKVFLVPGLKFNLMSVGQLTAKGADVRFKDSTCQVNVKGALAFKATLDRSRNWILHLTPGDRSMGTFKTLLRALPASIDMSDNNKSDGRKASFALWHRRLAHLNGDSMKLLFGKHSTGASIARTTDQPTIKCESCIMGKLVRPPFPTSVTRAEAPLDLVHSDLCGPMGVPSEGGALYMMILVDDCSRFTWVQFLKRKSDALFSFKTWQVMVERQLGRSIKVLRTDGGGEYQAFKDYLSSLGIVHQTTAPYTSQQNGVAERANRTVVERSIAVMHSERLPLPLWAQVMDSVVYLKNRSPSRSIDGYTPFERIYGHPPNLAHLRTLGATAWVLVRKAERSWKLDTRARLCVFIGYSNTQKAWKFWDVARSKTVVSRDAVFDEERTIERDARPLPSLTSLSQVLVRSQHSSAGLDVSNSPHQDLLETVGDDDQTETVGDIPGEGDELCLTPAPECAIDQATIGTPDPSVPDRPPKKLPKGWVLTTDPPGLPKEQPRSGLRSGRTRTYGSSALITEIEYQTELNDFLGRPSIEDSHPSDTRLPLWPNLSPPHALAAQAVSELEPSSWKEAMASSDAHHWQEAADDEMASLVQAKVFSEVERGSTTIRPITCKWVFKVKRDERGHIERYKARLVARGFLQRAGIDYDESFAPVAKFQSIRLILALAAAYDLELHQMDVKTAFLYGSLDRDVFMEQPEGYNSDGSKVWKLHKSLYGLKQAPRSWYHELHHSLLKIGFIRTLSDHSIYVRRDNNGLIIVGVYVDDLTIAAERLSTLQDFKSSLSDTYSMKDMGPLHFILGLQVERDRKTRSLRLHQSQYIDTIITRFNFQTARSSNAPLPAKTILTLREEHERPTDRDRYLSMLGSLMYAMLGTRPDLCYAVGMLARFAQDPSKSHERAITQVYKYLKTTQHLGITYEGPGGDAPSFLGYSDADFATNDPRGRRVTSGFAFKFWGGAVSWQSKRHPSVSLATADAEYVGVAQAARELVWLRSLASELGYPCSSATTLYCDNEAAITIARNPIAHSCTKQVDILFHFTRELVEREIVRLKHIRTHDMVADGLTKPLASVKFQAYTRMLGLSLPGVHDTCALAARMHAPKARTCDACTPKARTCMHACIARSVHALPASPAPSVARPGGVAVPHCGIVEGFPRSLPSLKILAPPPVNNTTLAFSTCARSFTPSLTHSPSPPLPHTSTTPSCLPTMSDIDPRTTNALYIDEHGRSVAPCARCARLEKDCLWLGPNDIRRTSTKPLTKCSACTRAGRPCSHSKGPEPEVIGGPQGQHTVFSSSPSVVILDTPSPARSLDSLVLSPLITRSDARLAAMRSDVHSAINDIEDAIALIGAAPYFHEEHQQAIFKLNLALAQLQKHD